jgi:hypothetical protein
MKKIFSVENLSVKTVHFFLGVGCVMGSNDIEHTLDKWPHAFSVPRLA